MKIGVDFDGVIVNFAESYLEFYNKKFWTEHNIKDWTSYEFSDSFGIAREDSYQLTSELFLSDEHNKMKLVEGAKKGIEKLAEKNDLCVITSRAKRFQKRTENLIKQNFPRIKLPAFYSDDIDRNHVIGKIEMCKLWNIEVFIEDNLEYAVGCSKVVDRVFLLNQNWNQGSENGVLRVRDWDEILERIG